MPFDAPNPKIDDSQQRHEAPNLGVPPFSFPELNNNERVPPEGANPDRGTDPIQVPDGTAGPNGSSDSGLRRAVPRELTPEAAEVW